MAHWAHPLLLVLLLGSLLHWGRRHSLQPSWVSLLRSLEELRSFRLWAEPFGQPFSLLLFRFYKFCIDAPAGMAWAISTSESVPPQSTSISPSASPAKRASGREVHSKAIFEVLG